MDEMELEAIRGGFQICLARLEERDPATMPTSELVAELACVVDIAETKLRLAGESDDEPDPLLREVSAVIAAFEHRLKDYAVELDRRIPIPEAKP